MKNIELTKRERLRKFFEDSNGWSARAYHASIYGLIATSVFELLSEYEIIHSSLTLTQHHIIDFSITLIFTVDYLARLWASPVRRRFVIDIYNIIDIFAILPSFIVLFTGFGSATTSSLRVLRLLRTLRILRLVRAANMAEKELIDVYYLKSRADDEFEYYKTLLDFYNSLSTGTNGADPRRQILMYTSEICEKTGEKLNKLGEINEKHVFLLGFLEFAEQLKVILARPGNDFNTRKIEALINDLGTLISAEHTIEPVSTLPSRTIPASIQVIRLFKTSLKAVVVTFAIGFSVNVILKIVGIHDQILPVLNNLLIIETVVGGLIVFITSFNLSFTNAKRSETDFFLIEFSNILNTYAHNIKAAILHSEQDIDQRRKLYEEINHYFDTVGFNVINSVRKGNKYSLKFDTAILQSFDRIESLVAPHLKKLDSVSRTYSENVRDNLVGQLNKFQIKATIRVPYIFNSLNSIIIRSVYLVLVAIAPYSVIPRLLIVNLLQRAFFVTASETDNAIFNTSLATLPIQDRVMRRLCRISKILSE